MHSQRLRPEKNLYDHHATVGRWGATVLAALLTGMGVAIMPVEPVGSLSAFAAVVAAGLALWLSNSGWSWARGAVEGCVWGGFVGAVVAGLLLRHPYWSPDETRPQDVILGLLIMGGLLVGAVTGGVRAAKARGHIRTQSGADTTPRDALLDETAAGLRVRVQPVSSEGASQAVPARAVVPCEICGKPGTPRAHPSAPTTMVLCDEHAANQSSFNPVAVVTGLFLAAVIAGVVWLLVRLWT